MKIRNHLARLVAGALLASSAATAVALAPSAAHAASTYSVTARLATPTSVVEYGDTFSIAGSLKGSDGYSPYEGTVYLQELPYGSRTWRTIATNTDTDAYFFDVPATISGSLRLYYGGHRSTGEYDDAYTAAYSNAVTLKVARKLTIKHKGLHMKGKVAPAHGKMKIVFKIKKGKHYKKWFKVKTKKNGKFSKTVPHKKSGTRFIVMVPGGQGYVGAVEAFYYTTL